MKHRILIVEDDEWLSGFYKEGLQSFLKVTIEAVVDNESAYKCIYLNPPDLIITDIVHVGGTGIDLFKTLRSEPSTSIIPIIIASGNIDDKLELQLYRWGVDGVIKKPFRFEHLVPRVLRLLRVKKDYDVASLLFGHETIDLDYKSDINLSNKESRASLAKDVIAMANTGGGTIIIGVTETTPGNYERTGLSELRFATFEATKVGNALKKYVGSTVSVSVRRIEWNSRSFVVIKVPACSDTLAMACCDNSQANLFQGRIYIRTNSAETKEIQDSQEIINLIDRLVQERLKKTAG